MSDPLVKAGRAGLESWFFAAQLHSGYNGLYRVNADGTWLEKYDPTTPAGCSLDCEACAHIDHDPGDEDRRPTRGGRVV